MLTFRKLDYQKDIKQVIALIRKNLDDSYTEDFFKWKHLENPYGESYGFLALDKDKIVALRMFMFWEFSTLKGLVKALRPVDTVTDHDYRGKGIFKKLTLDGLEKNKGKYFLIYNTPNENSYNGYIKMGWKKRENMAYFRIGLINPFLKFINFSEISINELNVCTSKLDSRNSTNLSNEFLKWRYNDADFKIAKFNSLDNSFVIYKKSRINFISCIIVYRVIGDSHNYGKMLCSIGKANKTFLFYCYGDDLKSFQFIKTLKRKQPIVTLKEDHYGIGNVIKFSMGDLEGRL